MGILEQTNTFADQQVRAVVAVESAWFVNVVAPWPAGWTSIGSVAFAYDFVDDDGRWRWWWVDEVWRGQREVQIHHNQNHRFHPLPYQINSWMAIREKKNEKNGIFIKNRIKSDCTTSLELIRAWMESTLMVDKRKKQPTTKLIRFDWVLRGKKCCAYDQNLCSLFISFEILHSLRGFWPFPRLI